MYKDSSENLASINDLTTLDWKEVVFPECFIC